jgi:hypothetical protein
MRNVAVRQSDRRLASLLELAHGENLILTTPDGREFLLAELDSLDREIELLPRNIEHAYAGVAPSIPT